MNKIYSLLLIPAFWFSGCKSHETNSANQESSINKGPYINMTVQEALTAKEGTNVVVDAYFTTYIDPEKTFVLNDGTTDSTGTFYNVDVARDGGGKLSNVNQFKFQGFCEEGHEEDNIRENADFAKFMFERQGREVKVIGQVKKNNKGENFILASYALAGSEIYDVRK